MIRLPQRRGTFEAPGPWWSPLNGCSGRPEPVICCPSGHRAGIASHRIHPDGRVEPSLICECGWHEFIFLEGWDQVQWREVRYVGGGPKDGQSTWWLADHMPREPVRYCDPENSAGLKPGDTLYLYEIGADGHYHFAGTEKVKR